MSQKYDERHLHTIYDSSGIYLLFFPLLYSFVVVIGVCCVLLSNYFVVVTVLIMYSLFQTLWKWFIQPDGLSRNNLYISMR